MIEILLVIIALLLAVIAGFLIPTLLELRQTSRELNRFIADAESTLKPAVDEFTETMKHVRGIASGLNAVTEDVKKFSSAVGDAGEKIKKLTAFVDALPLKAAGLRAGLGAAVGYLVTRMFKKKDNDEEDYGEEN